MTTKKQLGFQSLEDCRQLILLQAVSEPKVTNKTDQVAGYICAVFQCGVINLHHAIISQI